MKKNQEGTLVEINREHFLKFIEDNKGFMKDILKKAGTTQEFIAYTRKNPNWRARDVLLEKIALSANQFEKNGFTVKRLVKYPKDYLYKV